MSTQVLHPGSIAPPQIRAVRTLSVGAAARAVRQRIAAHPEVLLVLGLLLVVGAAHGINMFHFPYYEDDEGTYMSQAWAIVHAGRLAPYTYWYDHAPAGWMQIALWTMLTGGFHTFGNSVDTGRVFILVLMLVSALLVYGIGRRISGSPLVGALAVVLFSLTAYGGYFQRRVLLDNITTPWMLLSIFLLLSPRLTLQKVWLSAVALSISVLSKEVTVFLIPVMTYLMLIRTDSAQRLFAALGWVGLLGTVLSQYVLMAVLNSELFPTGTLLGGTANHVSLLGSLQYQASRSKDGGLLDPNSAFWQVARGWIRDEPLLVVGGTACALLAVLLMRQQRLIGVIGLLTFSLWAFMARGGEVIEFYLVPLLPLLALNIALAFWLLTRAVTSLVPAPSLRMRRFGSGIRLCAAVLCLSFLLLGYLSPDRGFAGNHLLLWTSTQADAQQQALSWISTHVPARSKIVMDNYAYTDLHDGSAADGVFNGADYYWKLDQDPAIGGKVYHDSWSASDYVLYTIQMHTDIVDAGLKLTGAVYRHSILLAHFDTGGWPVEVRKVVHPGSPAPDTALPVAQQFAFVGGTTTSRSNAVLSLVNPTTLPASAQLTFIFADGTVVQRGLTIDASSRKSVEVSGLQPHSGVFGLVVQTDRPITAYLLGAMQEAGTMFPSRIAATQWTVRGASTSLQVLNPDPSHAARLQLRDGSGSSSVVTVAAHALATIPSGAAQTLLKLTADRPVVVQEPGDSSITAGVGSAAISYQTLVSGTCQGDLVRGASAPARLVSAHCATDSQIQQFVDARIRPTVGSQLIIPQAEFPGTPGNSPTGSVWFGASS